MYQILDYLYNNLNVKESILDTNRENAKPTDHLSMALKLPAEVAKARPQKQEYIILDESLKLHQCFNYLFFFCDAES